MGEQHVNTISSQSNRSKFIKHLLDDVKALEIMLDEGKIEDDIIRIGAEQEFCLVTEFWRPSKDAVPILATIDDPHFTTELARYNLEINLDPYELKSDCFSKVETQLNELLAKANAAAKKQKNKVLLTGILPTISKNELQFEYMTPHPRYKALNDIIKELRGADFELHIRGVDELSITHDSVLFEACNTSFQMHLQIPPKDFISSFNWAQAISGPILGVSTNSPLLLGRELWSETRIALFRQSLDTRNASFALKNQHPRVNFGNEWASGTIADIFKGDIAQHRVILEKDIQSSSLEDLKNGKIPKLQALCVHNGTIYRWNRPCYGVSKGIAHVRIENRYIPAGPTSLDEMANFVFWVGLMVGRPPKYDDMASCMDFRDVKSNFIKASRTGRQSIMQWMGETMSVRKLVIDELLPIAKAGLKKMNIDGVDINRFLNIIEQRAGKITGAQWSINSYRQLRKTLKQDDALLALTKKMHENQSTNLPVHEWPSLKGIPETHDAAYEVSHIMSTQLFTVNEDDMAQFAISIMEWKNIHHVPVEDNSGAVRGLLTWTHIQHLQNEINDHSNQIVADIMVKDFITVRPETKIKEAIRLMKQMEIGCLPVIHDQHLVGIVTIKDLIDFDHD
jgi:CBS domain-containing protein